mmetsp:Transcript_24362/g.35620  ORF Transcript_24362/g.35620 Transcript_24362/m.35620 type:complete len:341 (+) Transcript_24362:91-1113(+)|eukprot:CAMPEP_0195524528 /NCGR_PEP_ID=MMETSP0794_2-20130614/24419_1 /TAXON_ID=515487 /ORGANISM="Stephanopyxis turris, Strain CCMP 815" /LENGTH=340 /DNA_ID=CAMNT_0040654771 /DNA_START=91 /DNA_END=1113 /DNA_ORIENTATION=+
MQTISRLAYLTGPNLRRQWQKRLVEQQLYFNSSSCFGRIYGTFSPSNFSTVTNIEKCDGASSNKTISKRKPLKGDAGKFFLNVTRRDRIFPSLRIKGIVDIILGDIDAAIARDPAARSRLEVGLLYPGIQAVLLYRMCNWLWLNDLKFTGRFISQFARWMTGIEIHPGATIGNRFFIDHGMGVVIGETSRIGDDVTLYHGVTLGGVSPSINSENQRNQKRHPTIEDGVIVGSGAQILGPITVGRSARVGANAVVTRNVPASETVIGVPARTVRRLAKENKVKEQPKQGKNFLPYGTPCGNIPDPKANAITGLLEEMQRMRIRLDQLEEESKRNDMHNRNQ